MSLHYSDSANSDIESITPAVTSASQAPVPSNKLRENQRKKRRADEVWKLGRKPRPGEAVRPGGRRVWYCKFDHIPIYSVLSTNGARYHMERVHNVIVPGERLSKIEERKNKDLRVIYSEHTLKKQQRRDDTVKAALKEAAEPAKARATLARLIIQHDLPLNTVTWPALSTFVHSINHEAKDSLFKSRSHFRRYIHYNYLKQQGLVKDPLSRAKSVIHLGTDTWHAPNRHELQGITAHYLDEHGKLQKVLLSLPASGR